MKNLINGFWLCIGLIPGCNSMLYSQHIEIRFQPSDHVYVYETRGVGSPGELYSAVIQNMAVINRSSDSLAVRHIEISAQKEGVEFQKVVVPYNHLEQSAQMYKTYQDQGILEMYDFQFQTSRYLKGIAFSGSTSLQKDEALVITHRAFLFQMLPDSVKLVVRAMDPDNNTITVEKSLPIINHESTNEYHLPLKGTWVAAAAPSLISHHRWASIQEFAFDFIKIGENGKTHKGDGSKLSDYYAYGEPIYSIGDGRVVRVKDGAIESDQNLRQADEASEVYMTRVMKDQQALLAAGFENVMGNYIIIEHEGGEFSYYLHLKYGSLKVQAGDSVRRGQQIAALGHSGNSTEPHLHFHLTDGADMSYSRSIPISFHNIALYPDDNGQIRHLHSGQIITSTDR